MNGGPNPRRLSLPRGIAQVLLVALGLALGLGGALALNHRGSAPARRSALTPSVTHFSFSTVPPAGTEPEALPSLAREPADATAAATLLLRSLADGRPEAAWPVLDEAARQRYPAPAAWARARAGRPAPTGFEVTGEAPGSADSVDVSATVTYRPSLDPFAGLVPARSDQVWNVHREGGAWRVAAEPVSTRFALPADDGARDTVRSWVTALASCDSGGARALQAVDHLYGPADVANVPCRQGGEWAVGQPLTLDRAPDASTLLAAFGAEVGSWSRVIPVWGPSNRFLAAVAPLGDTWRVIGVTADAP